VEGPAFRQLRASSFLITSDAKLVIDTAFMMRLRQMKLHINGEERHFTDASAPTTLAALVEILGLKPDRVAVELNRKIVPRDRWPQTQLHEGDHLEIVHFVGGGCLAVRPALF
jgi:sulfur carrier protein